MNTRRDPDLLIKAYLEAGVNELPERSYDAVRAATEQKRQWVVIGPWKEQTMITYARFALAAAAIVLVAIVGVRFLPGTITGPGATPGPTISPMASPPLVVNPLPSTGMLAPGTY